MDDPARQPAVAVARDLASRHPTAKLPCPLCGATLRADNLDKHLAKTHPTPSAPPSPWRGRDRAAIRPLVVLALLCAAALVGAQLTLALPFGPPQLALLVPLWLALGLIALAYFDRLTARLALDGDVLRLRYCFGLFTRSVRLPAALEVGALVQFRADPLISDEVHAPGHDETVGHYLRLSDGARHITVACTHKSGFRSHWSGWRPGPRRRAWDITLDRPALAALEYQLAARALLSPKTGVP